MDSNCFGALFGGLCSNLPDCMAQAQVASMTVSREKAELRVGLRMASIAPKARLYEVQKQLCEKLRLKKCVLSPQYDVSLLDGSYIEQVVEELRHRNCLVNGFLDGVSADYQGGVMQIHLKRGGLALLQSAGSDRRIREILRQEFGADIEVVFDGVTELEEYSKEFTCRLIRILWRWSPDVRSRKSRFRWILLMRRVVKSLFGAIFSQWTAENLGMVPR